MKCDLCEKKFKKRVGTRRIVIQEKRLSKGINRWEWNTIKNGNIKNLCKKCFNYHWALLDI